SLAGPPGCETPAGPRPQADRRSPRSGGARPALPSPGDPRLLLRPFTRRLAPLRGDGPTPFPARVGRRDPPGIPDDGPRRRSAPPPRPAPPPPGLPPPPPRRSAPAPIPWAGRGRRAARARRRAARESPPPPRPPRGHPRRADPPTSLPREAFPQEEGRHGRRSPPRPEGCERRRRWSFPPP